MKIESKKNKSQAQIPFLEKLDNWLARNKVWVIAALVVSWTAVRVSYFVSVANGPLYNMYLWSESDNRFFDDWAKYLNQDWLNKKPLHHYHSWHIKFAEYYFQKHPDKLQEILDANPIRDSTFIPGKVLWNEWYKGNQYHQEPLYAYSLAFLYFIKANAIKTMMILQLCLGVFCGIILFFLSRKYFGETVAALTGVLYLFCGILLIHELVILRTSWIVFLVVLNVWLIDRAFINQTVLNFLLCGICLGFSVLMWSAFSLFLYGMLVIAFFIRQKDVIHYLKISAILLIGYFAMQSPVIIRNVVVGAPALSSASGVESTFISTNAYGVNYVSGWGPVAERDAEILGRTYNSLPGAVIATLKTHPSVGSYLSLLLLKIKAIWKGIEWPDNLNYYFYKLQVPALKFAFIDFFLLAPLGLAGLIFCIHQRKRYFALYLAILINLIILMAFHVLGRYRAPLAVLSLPLAALAFIECLNFFLDMKRGALWKVVLVACLLYLSFSNHYFDINTQLRSADYSALYENYYLEKLEKLQQEGRGDKSLNLHREFLNRQPDFVSHIRAGDILNYPNQIALVQYFSQQHQIHSNILKALGDERSASLEQNKAGILQRVVENSKRNLRLQ